MLTAVKFLRVVAIAAILIASTVAPAAAGPSTHVVPTGDLTMSPDPASDPPPLITWGDTVSFTYTTDPANASVIVELWCATSEIDRHKVRLSGGKAILDDWASDQPAICAAILYDGYYSILVKGKLEWRRGTGQVLDRIDFSVQPLLEPAPV